MDPLEYIRAGYTPQCGCRLDSALEYVAWEEGYPTYIEDGRIWMQVDALSIPTPYYWEENMLFKKDS